MRWNNRVLPACLITCLLTACGGGGSGSKPPPVVIPPDAQAADARLKGQMSRFVPMMGSAQSGLMFVLNPDALQTPGITLQPDPQPGAAPHSFVFDGTYDGNGDGVSETSLTGRVTYAGDPASLDWNSLTGQTTIDVQIPLVGHVYHAALDFTVNQTEARISGSGTFTNPVTGETTTLQIAAAEPVILKPVLDAGGVANACGYNVDGSIPVQMAGPAGTYNSTWLFVPNSSTVTVKQASFRDPANVTTAMPDTSTSLACGTGGTIEDWRAVFDQHWVCLPLEHGEAMLTLTPTSATAVSIGDEDPPGSGDTSTYPATTIGPSTHALVGAFDAGPAGNHYRETFNWTLGKDRGFSQWSRYVYTEGANNGKGGICFATAKRLP